MSHASKSAGGCWVLRQASWEQAQRTPSLAPAKTI